MQSETKCKPLKTKSKQKIVFFINKKEKSCTFYEVKCKQFVSQNVSQTVKI